jgi:hypothetical protein
MEPPMKRKPEVERFNLRLSSMKDGDLLTFLQYLLGYLIRFQEIPIGFFLTKDKNLSSLLVDRDPEG